MRLLSYHVENYGKLHQQDGSFEEGLTVCCERNGFGKSTLVSFIKAMFYGLAPYTAASKDFVDRKPTGRNFTYFPLVEKRSYAKRVLNAMLRNYFHGSFEELVAFHAELEAETKE